MQAYRGLLQDRCKSNIITVSRENERREAAGEYLADRAVRLKSKRR